MSTELSLRAQARIVSELHEKIIKHSTHQQALESEIETHSGKVSSKRKELIEVNKKLRQTYQELMGHRTLPMFQDLDKDEPILAKADEPVADEVATEPVSDAEVVQSMAIRPAMRLSQPGHVYLIIPTNKETLLVSKDGIGYRATMEAIEMLLFAKGPEGYVNMDILYKLTAEKLGELSEDERLELWDKVSSDPALGERIVAKSDDDPVEAEAESASSEATEEVKEQRDERDYDIGRISVEMRPDESAILSNGSRKKAVTRFVQQALCRRFVVKDISELNQVDLTKIWVNEAVDLAQLGEANITDISTKKAGKDKKAGDKTDKPKKRKPRSPEATA